MTLGIFFQCALFFLIILLVASKNSENAMLTNHWSSLKSLGLLWNTPQEWSKK